MTQDDILKLIKWELPYSGGQQVARINPTAILVIEDLGIKIEMRFHNSTYRNKQEAIKMLLSFCKENNIIDQ